MLSSSLEGAFLFLLVLIIVEAQKESLFSLRFDPDDKSNSKRIDSGNQSNARIYGGNEVDPPGKYPFMALVYQEDNGSFFFICGASLISPNTVLCAAHCADDVTGVMIGRHDLTVPEEVEVWTIVETVVHPFYEFDDGDVPVWDVVLFRIEGPSAYSPVLLDDGSITESYVGGENVINTGWGMTETSILSPVLLYQETFHLNEADCKSLWGELSSSITDDMICAFRLFQSSCSGDSGGPLFVDENQSYTQIGVVSWGPADCSYPLPSVYARVSAFYDWAIGYVEEWESYLSPDPSQKPTEQPPLTLDPTRQLSSYPTQHPTTQPSNYASSNPSFSPVRQASTFPSFFPEHPTAYPSIQLTLNPTPYPTQHPTIQPSNHASSNPSFSPVRQPSTFPSFFPEHPTAYPSFLLTLNPTPYPSNSPSRILSNSPSVQVSTSPTTDQSLSPSTVMYPTSLPSAHQSSTPTEIPSRITMVPTGVESNVNPSSNPSGDLSSPPTGQPSKFTTTPTEISSYQPSTSKYPSSHPSSTPTGIPSPDTMAPTIPVTFFSNYPSEHPSYIPTGRPSRDTTVPTTVESSRPSTSKYPSLDPSGHLSSLPTGKPSKFTIAPTNLSSFQPSTSKYPSSHPSRYPSSTPTSRPSPDTIAPTTVASFSPSASKYPPINPSGYWSPTPTGRPSLDTIVTTTVASIQPSKHISDHQSLRPTYRPSQHAMSPIDPPSTRPSTLRYPSAYPSIRPTALSPRALEPSTSNSASSKDSEQPSQPATTTTGSSHPSTSKILSNRPSQRYSDSPSENRSKVPTKLSAISSLSPSFHLMKPNSASPSLSSSIPLTIFSMSEDSPVSKDARNESAGNQPKCYSVVLMTLSSFVAFLLF